MNLNVELIFTAANEVYEGCFYTCLSIHRGIPIGYYGIRETSGWYASYWNAFLLHLEMQLFI